MEIYDFTNYKDFVHASLGLMPKRGHGQLSKMALKMGVNSSLLSQVFNGQKNLTEEQAHDVAEFLALNSKETFFFVLLVIKERASHSKLKKTLLEQIKTIQKESKFLKNRIIPDKDLTFEQQAVFYSNWILTAIYTLSSIERFSNVHAFSEHLHISPMAAKKAIDILIEYGLCVEKDGRIEVGPKSTFVAGDSALVTRHHANWRIQALEKMADYSEEQFFYTIPFSISNSDYQLIRQELVKLIEKLTKRINATDPVEQVACLNIDFFKF